MSRIPEKPSNLLQRVRASERRGRGIGARPIGSWNPLLLLNGWHAVTGYATPSAHALPTGHVHLTGVVGGGASGSVVAVLDAGLRPASALRIATICGAGMPQPAKLEVGTDGRLTLTAPDTAQVALDGIIFRRG